MLEWILETLGPWTWWVLGLLLLGIEILIPGAYIMWFGLAALSVGTFALVVPMSWTAQLLLFAGLSVVAVIIGRVIAVNTPDEEDSLKLNERGSRYVGRTYFLMEPIRNGAGRLDIEDTIWRIRGPDLAAGEAVRVTGVDGATLVVEAAAGDTTN